MDEESEFRIGIWPGGVIPVPPLVASSCWLEGDFLHFDVYYGVAEEAKQRGLQQLVGSIYVDRVQPREQKRVDLPLEFYLREVRELPLNDPQAILEFCNTWGVLGTPGLEEIGEPWIATRSPLLELTKGAFFQGRQQLWRTTLNDISGHLRAGETFQYRHFVHVKEIAAHAALLRDLSRLWDVESGGTPAGSLESEWESWWLPVPTHPLLIQGLLVDFLTHALRPFHVTLSIMRGNKQVHSHWLPTLFSASCLQLANDIALQQPYRRCQKCGRLFLIQRGRAKYGQHRKEGQINFCSSACAKAKAQSDLYHRRAKAREMFATGASVEAIANELRAKPESVRRWVGPLAEGRE